jgi:exosortase
MTPSRRTLLFGIYSLCLMLVNAGVLRALTNVSLENPTASHHVLIPLVTLALLYQGRAAIFSSLRSAPVSGLAVFLFGFGLSMAGRLSGEPGRQMSSLGVMVGGLVVMWVGGFLVSYGWDAVRAALFPLLFLVFMIPIPRSLLDAATLFLKTGSAEAVAGLFTLTGTPYYREAFVFSMPRVAIEIADECSGIRSSIALLLTSLLAGHLFLRTGWKQALLVAVVVPMAIVKNSIRIVSLSLLASYVDPGFLNGQLHHEGGIVFFLITLALLAPLFVLLVNSETALTKEHQ